MKFRDVSSLQSYDFQGDVARPLLRGGPLSELALLLLLARFDGDVVGRTAALRVRARDVAAENVDYDGVEVEAIPEHAAAGLALTWALARTSNANVRLSLTAEE